MDWPFRSARRSSDSSRLHERRPVVEARLAVPLGLLLDELHEPRVVERDGGRVREELEPAPELGPASRPLPRRAARERTPIGSSW